VSLRAERGLAVEVVRSHGVRVGVRTAQNPQGEGYLVEEVATDRDETVGNDRRATVRRDERTQIERDRVTRVWRDNRSSVGGSSESRVQGDEVAHTGGSLHARVAGARHEEVGGASVEVVRGDASVSVGGDMRTFVRRCRHETLGADETRRVQGTGALSYGQDYAVSAGKTLRIEAGDAVRISCAGASIELNASGVVIEAPDIVLKASKGISLQSPDTSIALRDGAASVQVKKTVTLQADREVAIGSKGASVKVRASGNAVELSGAKATLTAQSSSLELSTDATLIGAVVKLNPSAGGAKSMSADATPEELKTSWVDVWLEDDLGTPVGGARFVVEMANGERIAGVLNAMGAARVRTVPGASKVTFPELDASAWKER
jgi:endonuclease YncB( thermonuclease family)